MRPYLKYYQATEPSLWQGPEDTASGRFFQHVLMQNLHNIPLSYQTNTHLFLGFCSDEGIRRNQGRTGAAKGPLALREALAKIAYHGKKTFIDLGNIICVDNDLEGAQSALSQLIDESHALGYKTHVFGGGHEMAYGHFLGLAKHYPKMGIINFDAHFDLRPLTATGLGTSGTPFLQIKEYCKAHHAPFHYACLGIQKAANTASLFQTAQELQVSYLTAEALFNMSLEEQKAFLDGFLQAVDAVYLSICMDVFAEAYAPGVSAPQALGLTPWQILPLLKYLLQTGKVVSTDLAELSPRWDEGAKTARLAAMIAAETLMES